MDAQEYQNLFNYYFSDQGEYDDCDEKDFETLKDYFHDFSDTLTPEQQDLFKDYCTSSTGGEAAEKAFKNLCKLNLQLFLLRFL